MFPIYKKDKHKHKIIYSMIFYVDELTKETEVNSRKDFTNE